MNNTLKQDLQQNLNFFNIGQISFEELQAGNKSIYENHHEIETEAVDDAYELIKDGYGWATEEYVKNYLNLNPSEVKQLIERLREDNMLATEEEAIHLEEQQ